MSCSIGAVQTNGAVKRHVVYVRGTASPQNRVAVSSPPAAGEKRSEFHDVRALGLGSAVKARHWLVVDDLRFGHAEAVELRAHRAAVGAEHANLDIVADVDVARQLERP